MKILTVVGARPQIIKSAAITHKIQIAYSNQITEVLVHSGQHYDSEMSDNFFEELGIPKPAYNLGIGSARHGAQTAAMLEALEGLMQKEQPDVVLIYGDTNSTVAAALAASKMGFAVAHVEAGMRSFNKSMPEELNRVLSDHASTYLFCPTDDAVNNLLREGFPKKALKPAIDSPYIGNVGDVMYDNALRFASESTEARKVVGKVFKSKKFGLATLHRASNTENQYQVENTLEKLARATQDAGIEMILPLHPRTANILGKTTAQMANEKRFSGICFTAPLGYLDILWCAQHAKIVVTDSGGLQKEAAFFDTPSLVLRSETEWTELVSCGLAVLTDAADHDFSEKFTRQLNSKAKLKTGFYGDGNAAGRILDLLLGF